MKMLKIRTHKNEEGENSMPMVEVKCSVSNCNFWGQGNNCLADEIMVDIDQHADYKTEISNEFNQTHQDRADSSKETCCKTFKPKQK